MTNYTAFNYSKSLSKRDLSKLYETHEFESSSTDQDYISLSELVENGVSGVLRSNTGRRKVMNYDDIIEPVERFDLSDFDPNGLKEAQDYFTNKGKDKENVKVSQDGVSSGPTMVESQPSEEEVSSITK